MKQTLKLSGTLLLNQFLADIACAMCVIPFPFMFGDNLVTYILFAVFIGFFFYYISYHGAYKVGFHDVGRRSSVEYDKGYLKRGLTATFLAAAPSILMFILFIIGKYCGIVSLSAIQFPLLLWSLFGYWPLVHIFPNHIVTVFVLCILMQIIFPMVGYISGYKGIVYFDRLRQAFFPKDKE